MTRTLSLLLGFVLALLPTLALGHSLSVSHLDVDVPADGSVARVELDLAVRDLALTLPLDADGNERVTWGEVLAIRQSLEAMVLENVAISSEGHGCVLSPAGIAMRRYDDGAYVSLQLSARCRSGKQIAVDYRLLFDADPQHRALVTLRSGKLSSSGIAHIGASRVELSVENANPLAKFLREGIHHILIGYDHIAFLVCLLLPAALVRREGKWLPSPGFRASFLHVLGIISAFTLAHSITLSLAALGWIRPASRWVELAIAFSVLVAALNNLRPLVSRRLWIVAFGFGLVHGLGFAGALAEVGLPAGARLLALLGFNLGVELGQLGIAALLFPVFYLLRRQRWYPMRIMVPASVAIALLAGYWLLQRLPA